MCDLFRLMPKYLEHCRHRCRSVLMPKCLGAEVSVHPADACAQLAGHAQKRQQRPQTLQSSAGMQYAQYLYMYTNLDYTICTKTKSNPITFFEIFGIIWESVQNEGSTKYKL